MKKLERAMKGQRESKVPCQIWDMTKMNGEGFRDD